MVEQVHEEKTASQLDTLSAALDSGVKHRVNHLLSGLSAAEIGDLLGSLPLERRRVVWDLVDPQQDGEVLVEVNDEVRANLIRNMTPDELVSAVDDLDLDDLADILDDLPEVVIATVLNSMDRQDRERLDRVLSYPEDSAGGLMDPDVLSIRPDVSLDVVLRYLRSRRELPEVFDLLFVVDRSGRYLGSLKHSVLVTREPTSTVAEHMDRNIRTIPVDMPATQVATEFQHHDLISAPVIDANQRLAGTITIDDIVDVMRDEAEHSVLTMAGLDEDDDMSAPAMLKKELAVGLMNGTVFATVVGAIAVLWYGQMDLGVVIAFAILINLAAGALAGAMVPLILRRMSIDPALAGGVVLTTVTDVVGIFAFVGLASFVLMAN